MALAAGTRLGPYEIVEPLGRGGMGEVYRARDVRLGRDIALKLLHPQLAADRGQRERFEREARAVGSLNHPNLLVLFDLGSHDGVPFLVTELLDGEPLRRLLDRGPIDTERALGLAAQVAHGLAAAHERGVVHRDLKPENLVVARDGRVKILDFGLARFQPAEAMGDLPTIGDDQLTAVGDLLGTPAYMAPEQVRGEVVDGRADLFALGVVLYEMLFGRRPFEGDSPLAILSAILHHPLPELASDAGSQPPAVRAVLARCLARDPKERFRSAAELAERLESLLRTQRTPSGSTTPDASVLASSTSSSAEPDEIRSIAILPFANRTGDPGADFLADGIAEQILNSLSQLAGLKVLARATCFRFRARLDEPIEVGRELGARAVVTGRLLQVSGRLLV
ncbi:MAG: protein kinase domain-containing protein, partial [Myxococcota bacterium]